MDKRKTKIVIFCIVSLLLNCFLPAYSQSGFSNIGSFFNKGKQVEAVTETEVSDAPTIKDVLIEGNRLIPEENILSAISSKAGTKFDKDKVLSDLEAIDRLGYFIRDSIQATPEKQDEDQILLKIRIEENNPITRVQILGNSIINTPDLLFVV